MRRKLLWEQIASIFFTVGCLIVLVFPPAHGAVQELSGDFTDYESSKATWQKWKSKRSLWEKVRSKFHEFYIETMEDLYQSLLYHKQIPLPQ